MRELVTNSRPVIRRNLSVPVQIQVLYITGIGGRIIFWRLDYIGRIFIVAITFKTPKLIRVDVIDRLLQTIN